MGLSDIDWTDGGLEGEYLEEDNKREEESVECGTVAAKPLKYGGDELTRPARPSSDSALMAVPTPPPTGVPPPARVASVMMHHDDDGIDFDTRPPPPLAQPPPAASASFSPGTSTYTEPAVEEDNDEGEAC
jgi:hypothetical protein